MTARHQPTASASKPSSKTPSGSGKPPASSLEEAFNEFASFGAGSGGAAELDSGKFSKLCKECKLFTKSFTTTDADIIFTKAKAKGKRKISFAEFEQALEMVAEKKGKSKAAVVERILQAGGPMSSGTRASSGGVLDRMTDTAQYTGSHKVRSLTCPRTFLEMYSVHCRCNSITIVSIKSLMLACL